jgi:hypothetical protein
MRPLASATVERRRVLVPKAPPDVGMVVERYCVRDAWGPHRMRCFPFRQHPVRIRATQKARQLCDGALTSYVVMAGAAVPPATSGVNEASTRRPAGARGWCSS